MTDRELMKWALYALEGSNAYDWPVVEELKERLAQPEQELHQWQGLTDEELNQIYAEPQTHAGQYARAIEAKLKAKNA